MAQPEKKITRSNRFVDSELQDANRNPIYGYQHLDVMPLEDAVERIVPFVDGVKDYVTLAKSNCIQNSTSLTCNESAAIYLYTMSTSFYMRLNEALRVENRDALKPWFAFLKLFITALEKLPSIQTVVWRGVSGNVSSNFVNDTQKIWWCVNSCSRAVHTVEPFLGVHGTLFTIETIYGKDIAAFSAIPDEQEIVLMPGTRLCVKAWPCNLDGRYFIVHLQERLVCVKDAMTPNKLMQ
ncbi:unnamed protein product [Rotaria socialis]